MKTTTKTNPLMQKLLNHLTKAERHLQQHLEFMESLKQEIHDLQQLIDERE